MIALVSDVHANLVALEAVLREVPREAPLWVMGDTVGYGPDPGDVFALLRERGARMVAGNHDLAAAGRISIDDFNPDAAEAARRHREWLSPADREALAALPLTLAASDFTLVHGSLRDPVWEYVFDGGAARSCLELARTAHCCNGHTHVPAVFALAEQGTLTLRQPRDGETYALRPGRALVNPGSVGQPRDGDPRAAWALLDPLEATITFRRTSYDVAETQRRMRAQRLPLFLVERLAYGL